jgi:hypothetical protein
MATRDHAKGVWVDLVALFGQANGSADGIDVSQPAPDGLIKWMRTSDGGWVGVVNVVITMTNGSTLKLDSQLVPARALKPR